jgi:hypothetical protein
VVVDEVLLELAVAPAHSVATDSPLAAAAAVRSEKAVEPRFGFEVSVPLRVEASYAVHSPARLEELTTEGAVVVEGTVVVEDGGAVVDPAPWPCALWPGSGTDQPTDASECAATVCMGPGNVPVAAAATPPPKSTAAAAAAAFTVKSRASMGFLLVGASEVPGCVPTAAANARTSSSSPGRGERPTGVAA